MTAFKWKSEVTGIWTTTTDWSPAGTPGSADTVTVSNTGSTAFTINVNAAQAASLLTLNSADATLSINSGGSLTVGTTLALSTGTLLLNGGGTIGTGGVLVAPTFNITNGTLGVSSGATMTIASGTTITHTGGLGADITGMSSPGTQTGTVINSGVISSNAGGGLGDGTLTIDPATFVNNGTITTTSGKTDIIDIEADSVTNAGLINVAKGNIVQIGELGNTTAWSNTGTISVAAGGELDLGIDTTVAGLGSIEAVRSRAINNGVPSSAIVSIDGVLDNTGTTIDLTVTTGTLTWGELQLTGTIIGGTIKQLDTVPTIFDSGTLQGVTYDGVINLSVTPQTFDGGAPALTIVDGLTLNTAAGATGGTIDLTGTASAGAVLTFDDTQTFNNATITIGDTGGTSELLQQDTGSSAGTLTLGSGVTIVQNVAGDSSTIETAATGDGDAIVSDATINVSAGSMAMGADTLTNGGSISVSGGAVLNIGGLNFINAAGASIAVGANSTAFILSAWSNEGTISIAAGGSGTSGGALHLGGTVSTSNFGSITNSGGTLYLDGTFNNAGTALTLGTGATLGQAVITGTINGGTIVDDSATATTEFHGATLDGVTYDGTINLALAPSSSFGFLNIIGGLTLNDAAGTGPGTLDVTGSNSSAASVLDFVGTQTFDNATVNIGATPSVARATMAVLDDNGGADATLTLGAHLTINQAGTYAKLTEGSLAGAATTDTILNEGTIAAATAAGNFLVANAVSTSFLDFVNQGAINVSNGDTFDVESLDFANSGTVSVNGATLVIGASTSASNSGTISLTGGTVNATALTDATGGAITGTGSVAGTITNSGKLEASGGALTFEGAVSGTGTGQIDSGATLTFDTTVGSGTSVSFVDGTGTLGLAQVGGFSATVSQIFAGDTIDLINTAADTVTLSGNQLIVSDAGTTIGTINLGGSGPDLDYTLSSDGHGGTDITAGPNQPPATTVPGAQTVTAGQETAIVGVSISDSDASSGPETFTVVVSDTTGLLTATGAGITGIGTNQLTITGSLGQVNADLATLGYTGATGSTSDTITVTANDGRDGTATPEQIGVTVNPAVTNPLPKTNAPKKDIVTSGDPTIVSGVSVSDPNLAADAPVTVTVKEGIDDTGLLSIAGSGSGATVTGSGTRKLVITGTLAEVNADLANLTYQGGSTDGAASISATLTVKTDDANGQSHANIAMTVDQAQPAITAPSTDTVTIGESTPISGVSVTDTEVPSDAIINMTLSDVHGLLYATQPGGGTVTGSGTKDLSITGTVAQVDAHLASLAYVGKADGNDVITASVTDGTNSAATQIHMTVQALATFGANVSGTTDTGGSSGGTQNNTPTLTPNPMAA